MENEAVPDEVHHAKQFALEASNFTILEGVLYFIDPQSKQLHLAIPQSYLGGVTC